MARSPFLPEDFAPPLADPNPEGRMAFLRGLLWACTVSVLLWIAMFLAWRLWGWWGPPGVLLGGALTLVAVGLATRVRDR